MEKLTEDTINLWRKNGRQVIPQNFEQFRSLVSQSQAFENLGKYSMAAVYGEMAASYACGKHCGLFVSPELENILLRIGKKAISSSFSSAKNNSISENPKYILHVATSMQSIGGHSRMLWRWIQQDIRRSHSLILTRQSPKPVPQVLKDSIHKSSGRIHILNERIGSLISWASYLRKIASTADLVVLHAHNYDVIPIIAFANKENLPPILLLDHADHLFWLGVGISDVVISLRESGMRLAKERRHIEPKRVVILPIILEPIRRTLSRREAKQQLNISEEGVLLLSIARALKYKTIDGLSFADAHVTLLKQYKQATLIVIGPGDHEDWSKAIQQTDGRILVLPETEHTSLYYQAADIYVDSFPFISNTSLLEAGSYGVPLVSRYPYSSESCGVLGADMPGLTNNLIRVEKKDEYTLVLSKLIEDEEYRISLGKATQKKIIETHYNDAWQNFLNNVYSYASNIDSVSSPIDLKDTVFLDEPDVFLHKVHDIDMSYDKLIGWSLPLMPTIKRSIYWYRLYRKYGLREVPINLLLPEWLRSRYYSFRLQHKI